jgi:hypothetical protein
MMSTAMTGHVRAESRSPMAVDDDSDNASTADERHVGESPSRKKKAARKASADDKPRLASNEAKPKHKAKHVAAHGGKHHRAGRQPSAEYVRIRDGWHAPIEREPVANPPAFPPLVIAPVNGGERISIVPQREDGGFTDADVAVAARAFAPAHGQQKIHAIAPHLLDLVYRAMRHFDAPLVHLVSGYRADRAGSRHTQGRAIDMVLPGVSNEELADYVRTFGFVGVGVYPKSGFVHLDVRDASFFWLDDSLPDERCRTEPILPELAKQADAAARDRGEKPNAFVPNNEREDKAAARVYKKRAAQRRRAAAEHVRSL